MNPLKEKYYLGEIFKTRLGNSHGVIVKAKPVLLLSIIDCISSGHLKENRIEFDDTTLQESYRSKFLRLEPGKQISPFILPFFHLGRETYYNIKWTGKPFVPSPHGHSPSQRYMRQNSEYSYLDNGLWDILQESEVRERISREIEDYFFRNC